MSVSPAEPSWHRRLGPARIGAALVIGLFATTAAATEDLTETSPLRLIPPASLAPTDQTIPGHSIIQGRTGQGRTGPAAPAKAAVTAPGAIEVNPLDEIAPDSIGTLDPNAGGFGLEMWRGSEQQVVARLLRHLPDSISSREMRSLARRLLTSIASPPDSQFENSDELGPSLLALRLERLMALGEVAAVNDLLAIVPARHDDEFLARLRVDGSLLAHDYTEACRQVRNGIAVYHQNAYWQKALIFCQMAAGEDSQMMLGLDLLRERGSEDDPLFFTLAGAALGTEAKVPEDGRMSPLHLAMSQVLGLSLPDSVVETAAPPLLMAIAQAPSLNLEQRAAAAESACAKGLLDGALLAQIYDAYSFTPDELASAISAAESMEGPRLRALLYQAVRGQTLPATRAEILRVALDHGEQTGLYQALIPLYLPLLSEVSVTPELAWFATAAGRALYAAGRYEQASAWLMLGRQEALINPQGSTAAASLWPYSRLAGGAAVTTEGNLAAWRAMREGMGGEALDRLQTLLRAAFQALGERDPLSWSLIAADGEVFGRAAPNAALLYALDEASGSRRIGETVLLSLIVLGEAGPAESHAFVLSSVLSALGRVGLEREARALAIEAALASGI